MTSPIASGPLLAITISLTLLLAGVRGENTDPVRRLENTHWAYTDTRGQYLELNFGENGSLFVRRLKIVSKVNPKHPLEPGSHSFEEQTINGTWKQTGSVTEFSFPDPDIGSHPADLFRGTLDNSKLIGAADSSFWGAWKWTADEVQNPSLRPDAPASILLAVHPLQPADYLDRSGEATVAIKVSATGEVQDVAVLKSTRRAFGRSAQEAVQHWRFVPRVHSGRAVESTVEMKFSFSVHKSP